MEDIIAMTDDEYRDFLTALARKYLRTSAICGLFGPGMASAEALNIEIERLSSTARFLSAVDERVQDPAIARALANEIRNTQIGSIVGALSQANVLTALDDSPEITFQNLRRSVIPEEDAILLQRAGVLDVEAEITLLIQYCRRRVAYQQSPSQVMYQAQEVLNQAAGRVESEAPFAPPEKRRKLFGGIGKILAGSITGAGNLLLAMGTIVAPNPATAFGVIGSCALAVGGVLQGVGDLRGE
jgi:hypothetical protein